MEATVGRIAEHFVFYSEAISGDRLILDEDETRHAVSVLRTKPGDQLMVTDGMGSIFTVEIETLARTAICRIRETTIHSPSSKKIIVYVGLPERDNFESIVESLTPLGVASIIPVICGLCQKQWWDGKWETHSIRFRKKAISALKQSRNLWLPKIAKPCTFADAMTMDLGGFLWADAEGKPMLYFADLLQKREVISLFIGPPGGFSPEEEQVLVNRGERVVVAPYRLRTELAAVVAVSQITGMVISL